MFCFLTNHEFDTPFHRRSVSNMFKVFSFIIDVQLSEFNQFLSLHHTISFHSWKISNKVPKYTASSIVYTCNVYDVWECTSTHMHMSLACNIRRDYWIIANQNSYLYLSSPFVSSLANIKIGKAIMDRSDKQMGRVIYRSSKHSWIN